MAFGGIWTARTIAAVIIGLTIMGVAFLGIIQGMHGIKDHRTEMDARRVAGMLEAVDHKPGTFARLNFAQAYDIELTEEHVTLRGPASPKRHMINLHDLQEDALPITVSEVEHVCISHDGEQLSLSDDCSIPENIQIEPNNPEPTSPQDPSNPSTPEPTQGLITLYSQEGPGGESIDVDDTEIVLSELDSSWDGRVKSLEVDDGYTATLYENPDFSGQSMTVTGTADAVNFNDNMKSIRFSGDNCQARLYANAYTNDDGSISGNPEPYLTVGGASWNILNYGDRVRSVEIEGPDSCYARLWEDKGPSGACLVLGKEESDCDRTEPGRRHADINAYSDYYGDPGGGPGTRALVSAIDVLGGDTCRATIYNEKDFGGDDGKRYMVVAGRTQNLHWPRTGVGEGGNADSVSAITVSPDTCRAHVFRDGGFSGNSATFQGETTSLNLNDVSAIRLQQTEQPSSPPDPED